MKTKLVILLLLFSILFTISFAELTTSNYIHGKYNDDFQFEIQSGLYQNKNYIETNVNYSDSLEYWYVDGRYVSYLGLSARISGAESHIGLDKDGCGVSYIWPQKKIAAYYINKLNFDITKSLTLQTKVQYHLTEAYYRYNQKIIFKLLIRKKKYGRFNFFLNYDRELKSPTELTIGTLFFGGETIFTFGLNFDVNLIDGSINKGE